MEGTSGERNFGFKRLKEITILYPRKSWFSLNKVIVGLRYFNNYRRYLKTCIIAEGKPNLIHVNVCFRAGLLALWMKWKYKIPFVITEHWTLFTPEREDNVWKKSFLFQWIIRKILKEAEIVLPVSQSLESNLINFCPLIKTQVISNVVDTALFKFKGRSDRAYFTFIHVSSLKASKNPQIIIEAYVKLQKLHRSSKLIIIGDCSPSFLQLYSSFGDEPSTIEFLGAIEHNEVAKHLQNADAFVLFSDYETQSCVAIESLCCGVPVISSRLPCLDEYITQDNGILVPPRDEDALYKAMEDMMLNYSRYDRKRISILAQAKYNPQVVGQQIVDVYNDVLAKLGNQQKSQAS